LLYRLLPFDIRPSSFRPGRFRAFGDEKATIVETEGAVAVARGDDVEVNAAAHGVGSPEFAEDA
jgi:hypothetical protein